MEISRSVTAALLAAVLVSAGDPAAWAATRAAPRPTPAARGSYTLDVNSGLRVLRDNLLRTHARLDGQAITDLRLDSTCQARIVAGPATTTVRWGDMRDVAAHFTPTEMTMVILVRGSREHLLSFDRGDNAYRVRAGIGLIADICSKHR